LFGNVLVDALPASQGTQWALDPAAGECAIAQGFLVCAIPRIQRGASVSIHIASPTSPASCGTVVNRAAAFSLSAGLVQTGPVAIFVGCPKLTIIKAADAAAVPVGDDLGWLVTVTNVGDGVAREVAIDDFIPLLGGGLPYLPAIEPSGTDPGCGFSSTLPLITCGFGDVLLGESRHLHFVGKKTTTCGTVVNSASARSKNAGSPTTAGIPIEIECGRLAVTRTADSPVVILGDPVGWTVTVTNVGLGTAHGVSLTDPLPLFGGSVAILPSIDLAGTDPTCGFPSTLPMITCSFGDLAPGASRHLHFTGTLLKSVCGSLVNTASALSIDAGSATSAPSSVLIECGSLAVSNVADSTTVSAGGTMGWTVTVTNAGPATAHGVLLVDSLPLPVTYTPGIDAASTDATCGFDASLPLINCNFGDLAAGASKHLHFIGLTSSKSCGTFVNNAEGISTDAGNPVSPGAPIVVTCPTLHVSPGFGLPQSLISVSGSGFAGQSLVKLSFGGQQIGTVTTGLEGSFTDSLTVPEFPPGDYLLQAQDDAGDVAQAAFTISANQASPP